MAKKRLNWKHISVHEETKDKIRLLADELEISEAKVVEISLRELKKYSMEELKCLEK